MVVIEKAFSKLYQDTAEDREAVTNLTYANYIFTSKVEEYANNFSAWEAYDAPLHNTIENLKGELKNLKVWLPHNIMHIKDTTNNIKKS